MKWFLAFVFLAGTALGEDWPQWRGPAGSGVSSETVLPEKWTAGDARWKVGLAGSGASSPIVWGDLVVVTSQIGKARLRPGSHPTLARGEGIEPEKPLAARADSQEVQFAVEAFRRSDGARAWEHRFAAEGELPELHQNHNMASPSPVTDGRQVYAWFATGQLVALDAAGRLVWQRHMAREYAPFDIDWGHGSSPALYHDLLILLCDHKPSAYMVALDTRTGRERWKVDRGKELRSYSTPTVVRGPAGDELIVNTSARIESYEPATGKRLWFTGTPVQLSVPVPSFEDGVLYTSRGYRSSPYMAIRLGGRGDITDTHVLWSVPAGGAYVSSVVAYQGLIFMANDAGVLTCVDQKSGARLWQERAGGLFFASPVAGDGKVYFTAESGETIVAEAGRERRILARNRLGERITASPAISGGNIFFRSDDQLICIGK